MNDRVDAEDEAPEPDSRGDAGSQGEAPAPGRSGATPDRRAGLLVALLSAALLSLEIVHQQLLTFFAGYGLAQIAVNIALLGMGVGGLATLLLDTGRLAVWLTALPLLSAAGLWLGLASLAIAPFELLSSSVLLALPYVGISMVLSLTYMHFPSHRVYGSSLLGAALGVVGTGLLYDSLGAEWMVLLATLLLVAAGSLWSEESEIPRAPTWIRVFLGVLLLCLVVQPLRPLVDLARWTALTGSPTPGPPEDSHQLIRSHWERFDHSRWNLDGRLDVVGMDPQRSAWTACLNGIPVDTILRFRVEESFLDPRFALPPPEDGNALVIGLSAQGVSQVVRDMVKGRVVGVELNSAVVEAMEGPFYEASAQAYRGIDVRVQDGRSFIDRDDGHYGLITLMFTHPVKIPVGVPEYLFTEEAFESYLDHLEPAGHINVEEKFQAHQWERALASLRVHRSIEAALRSRGVEDPERHLLVTSWEFAGYRYYHTAVGRNPFTAEDLAKVRDRMTRGDRIHPRNRRIVFDPLSPGPGFRPSLEQDFEDFLDQGPFWSSFPERIDAGTSDAHPYLHPVTRDMPREWELVRKTLWMALPLFALSALGIFLAPRGRRSLALRDLLGLALLGTAYLLVEFHLVQRFQLFLGSYTFAFVVVLGILFVAGGIGSLLAQRQPPGRTRWAPPLLLLGLVLFEALGVPLLQQAMHLPGPARLACALVLTAPLGLLMGIPFPLALETAKGQVDARFAAYAFAANSALSVVGGALHILLAVQFAAGGVYLVAIGLYGVALLALFGDRRELVPTLSCLLLLGVAGARFGPELIRTAAPGGVTLEFLGHSSFRVRSPAGFTLLTDPYPSSIGLEAPGIRAHVVTSSHPHEDHGYMEAGSAHAVVLRGLHHDPGTRRTHMAPLRAKVYDFEIATYPATHNTRAAPEAGPDTIFSIRTGGIHLVHLGDLGQLPHPQVLRDLGAVDVLLLPVGGIVTLSREEAYQLVEALRPRLVIPMHYGVPGLIYPLAPLEDFLDGRLPARRVGSSEVLLRSSELPEGTELLVLDMAREALSAPGRELGRTAAPGGAQLPGSVPAEGSAQVPGSVPAPGLPTSEAPGSGDESQLPRWSP